MAPKKKDAKKGDTLTPECAPTWPSFISYAPLIALVNDPLCGLGKKLL